MNDPAKISFCNKNVSQNVLQNVLTECFIKIKTSKLNDKIFSQYKNLSLSYSLKLVLNFTKFEPQYSCKLYSYKRSNMCNMFPGSMICNHLQESLSLFLVFIEVVFYQ